MIKVIVLSPVITDPLELIGVIKVISIQYTNPDFTSIKAFLIAPVHFFVYIYPSKPKTTLWLSA